MTEEVKVASVVARCQKTKAEFGIRFEWSRSKWVADWSFLIKPGTAKREGYEQTHLSGDFEP